MGLLIHYGNGWGTTDKGAKFSMWHKGVFTYEEWCITNTNIAPLVRFLKSSLPEQYIGFYLHKVFGNEIEYQKQLEWVGRHSLDIYIPSLQLAIEYDGEYYHRNKSSTDIQKTSWCRSHGIYLIHIQEMKPTQDKSRKRNVVSYYYEKIIKIYRWPESKNYWLEVENQWSVYDVFYTDNIPFLLQCPYCQRKFTLFTRYFHHRKSFVPCECEYGEIERALEETIEKYKDTGELVIFDDSLWSRRLYDRMEQNIKYYLNSASKEEIEMYKKLGFESPFWDYYLTRF